MGDSSGPLIVYDGDCPFCARYVKMLRLRASIGDVRLMDARAGGAEVQAFFDAGYDLDEGMILQLDGRVYHGDDCVHRLALLSTGSGVLNRLHAAIFRSERASRLLYPLMRATRNGVLRLLGRPKIARSD